MDADDSSSEFSEYSDFSDLSNITEALWDTSDEEGEEDDNCDAEDSPVVQEGRRLWVHAEDRHGKAANRHRMRMDMEDRIRGLETNYGPTEFQETYKVTVPEFKALATSLAEYIGLVTHKAVCSSGSYVSAELRLSMFLRYLAGGQVKDIIHMHGVHNCTFYKVVWQVVDFINNTIHLSYPLGDESILKCVADGFCVITKGVIRNCGGAIDGIAIKIRCPRTSDTANPMQYFNRKGFYAFVLQGVCDHRLRWAIAPVVDAFIVVAATNYEAFSWTTAGSYT